MTEFHPFADDVTSIECAGLTVENGTDRVSLYGTADLTRDKAGLAAAQALRDLLDGVVRALETADLPDHVPPPKRLGRARNPFA